MERIDANIAGRTYSLLTDAGSVETLRQHAARLHQNAVAVRDELGEMPESLLLVVAAIQAIDELESRLWEREAMLASGTEVMQEATAQIRALTALVNSRRSDEAGSSDPELSSCIE